MYYYGQLAFYPHCLGLKILTIAWEKVAGDFGLDAVIFGVLRFPPTLTTMLIQVPVLTAVEFDLDE